MMIFTIENVYFKSMDVILRADVTVYLCTAITRFQNPLLKNTRWVLIIPGNEHCNHTSS